MMIDSIFGPEKELAREAPDDLLFPVIRRGLAAGSVAADRFDDVVAIYGKEIVIQTVPAESSLPDAAFSADSGAEALIQMLTIGPVFRAPWGEVESVEWSPCKKIGSRWKLSGDRGREFRLHLRSSQSVRFFLPEEDAAMVMVALERTRNGNARQTDKSPRFQPGRPRLRRREWAPRLWLALTLTALLCAVPLGAMFLEESGPSRWWETLIVGAATIVLFCYGYLLSARVSRPGRSGSLKDRFRRERKEAKRLAEGKSGGDLSARQPLRLRRLGLGLKILGGLALFAALFFQGSRSIADATGSAGEQTGESLGIVFFILSAACYLLAAPLLWAASRLMLHAPAQTDGSPCTGTPVVYLRPFSSDGRFDFNPDTLLAQSLGLKPAPFLRFLGPLAEIHPLRLFRLLFSRGAERAEEQMAGFFKKSGPFVAVGRPGERLSPGGADRIYVRDTEWQAKVTAWLDRAKFVVLQPGSSEGVLWEIQQAFASATPQRVLLCLVHLEGSQARWDAVRLLLAKNLTLALPRSVGDAPFLHFAPDGSAERLPRIFAHPLAWAWTGRSIDFGRTLAPFLAKLSGTSHHAVYGGRRRISRAAALFSAVCMNILFLALPALLPIAGLFIIYKSGNRPVPSVVQTPSPEREADDPGNDPDQAAPIASEEALARAAEYRFDPPPDFHLVETSKSLGDLYRSTDGAVSYRILSRVLTADEQTPGVDPKVFDTYLSQVNAARNTLHISERRFRFTNPIIWDEVDALTGGAGARRWLRLSSVTSETHTAVLAIELPGSGGLTKLAELDAGLRERLHIRWVERLEKTAGLTKPPTVSERDEQVNRARDAYQQAANAETAAALASALGNCGFSLLFTESIEDAEKFCREALELDPSQIWIRGNLAHSLYLQGRFKEALALYRANWEKPIHEDTFREMVDRDLLNFEAQGIQPARTAKIRILLGLD